MTKKVAPMSGKTVKQMLDHAKDKVQEMIDKAGDKGEEAVDKIKGAPRSK
jgi:F0F1-type ATP synthase membrane subunit b/b'